MTVSTRDASPAVGRGRLVPWWEGLGRGQRVLVAALVAVVVANAALAGTRSLLGGEPGGPASSSFSTGADGLEAYADLLRADGRGVVRLRERVGPDDVDPGATIVVTDPGGLDPTEARALVDVVADGGRLVVAGPGAAPLVRATTGTPLEPVTADAADRLSVWVPGGPVGAARELAGDRGGRWRAAGPLVPVAGADDQPAIVAGAAGRGTVVALADAALLHNAVLADADNAALGLALVGARDRRIVFVESVHGHSAAGLDAVPPGWKWAGAGLVAALVVALWSAGTRFGPPEPQRRALRPPRRDHVEAVAAGLDRAGAGPADAAGPLAATEWADLVARLGLRADASPAVVAAALERVGEDPLVVDELTTPPADLDAALAVGRRAAHRRRTLHPGTGARRHPDTVPTDPAPGGPTP